MSAPEPSSKSNASFLWVLGSFIGFAVLFYLIQTLFGTTLVTDPRSPDRLLIKEEVLAEQNDLLLKLGLTDEAKKAAVFEKAAAELMNRKQAKSAFVVPGSPTQLAQMAAGAPPPPPDGAAPIPAPAAVPAPVPAAVPATSPNPAKP